MPVEQVFLYCREDQVDILMNADWAFEDASNLRGGNASTWSNAYAVAGTEGLDPPTIGGRLASWRMDTTWVASYQQFLIDEGFVVNDPSPANQVSVYSGGTWTFQQVLDDLTQKNVQLAVIESDPLDGPDPATAKGQQAITTQFQNYNIEKTAWATHPGIAASFGLPTDGLTINDIVSWKLNEAQVDVADEFQVLPNGEWGVDFWTAASGESLAQATPSMQPTIGVHPNGIDPTLIFDSNDELATGAGSGTQPTTLFVAGRRVSGNATFFATDSGGDFFFGSVSGNWRLAAGVNLGGGSADADWHVFTLVVDGTGSEIRIDGVSVATGDAGSNGTTGFKVGGNIELAEIAALDRVATADEITAIETYMSARFVP